MVTRFGMSDKFGLMGLATVENEYLGGGSRMNCSDVTAADVDTEVMNILRECYEEAKSLLSENRELMDKLAAHLIEKETITGKEFMAIYRKEKGLPEPDEKEESGEKPGIKTEENIGEKPEEKTGKIPEEKPVLQEEGGLETVPADEREKKPEEEEPPVKQPVNSGPVGRFSNASGNFEDTLHRKIDEQK